MDASKKSVFKHTWTDGQTDIQTDKGQQKKTCQTEYGWINRPATGWTDPWTKLTSYNDAWTRLKSSPKASNGQQFPSPALLSPWFSWGEAGQRPQ